jgi:hypothetical protein
MPLSKGQVIEVFQGMYGTGIPVVPKSAGVTFRPGQYYWRAKARNGRIVAIGGEGYKRKSTCVKMAFKYGPQAWPIIEVKS